MNQSVFDSPKSDDAWMWQYQPLAGHFDEVTGPDGRRRPAWGKLIETLESMGVAELERRWEQGRRLIHENGVTYNIYNDAGGLNRPWQLDAIPFVIDADEWTRIEAAVAQRARLINLLLADLYGPQNLLTSGLFPPELLYANEGFLRAAHGIGVPHGIWLHQYAADLARSPSGDWWVVNDRTQAPSGAGYALENRLVVSRSMPEVFRDWRVMRLAEFFGALRDFLAQLSPARKERPAIVLLTPGPYNETYFEHAYLARYLGYTLVEPGDLTVRDARVYLKTLDGLMPVDVILRRLDDGFCDHLELREDSLLGVPGLVHAVRSGNVVVANALGSGAVETPAIMPFLPALARNLLGESLLMPSVATWWCGHSGPLDHVERNLSNLVIKPTFPHSGGEPIFGDQLSPPQRQELITAIQANPVHYTAQDRVHLSTAPMWADGRIQPRHLMLRVFAVANAEGNYSIMPGGLTRVGGSKDSTSVGMRSGGGSKDTWVLGNKPAGNFTLLQMPAQTARLNRQGFVLSSRVADNLYWLGRHAERIEGATRVIRCALDRLTDESDFNDAYELPWLVDVLVDQHRMLSGIDGEDMDHQLKTLGAQFMSLLFDGERPNSVRSDIQKIYRIGSMARDRISIDAWRILSRLESQFVMPDVSDAVRLNAAHEVLDDAILTLTAFSGQTVEGMTHEKGWRFLDMGRRIERALNLLDLIRRSMQLSDGSETQRMQSLLEIANNAMTYRSRYQSSVAAEPVLDLLMLDESNPRSLAYQIASLESHIQFMAGDAPGSLRPPEQRMVMRMLTNVRLADINDLARPQSKGTRASLVRFIDRLAGELSQLSDEMTRRYLSHAGPSRRFNDLGRGR